MTTAGKYILELTPSQKMALTDALLEHLSCACSTEVFFNCSEVPPVETTIGELVRIVTDARCIDESRYGPGTSLAHEQGAPAFLIAATAPTRKPAPPE